MAQVYARPSPMAARNQDTQQEQRAAQASAVEAHAAKREDAAIDFANKRDALLACLQESTSLVSSLASFNDARWTLQYPHDKLGFAGAASKTDGSSALQSAATTPSLQRNDPLAASNPSSLSTAGPSRPPISAASAILHREQLPRRSASMFGEDQGSHARLSQSTPIRPGLHARSATTMVPSTGDLVDSPQSAPATAPANSHPLAIDLRLGAPGQTAVADLMGEMAASETARLLNKRFEVAKKQLNNLTSRVRDNQSRILVTGDLNAGKSTFVNALLRRDVLPTDQQPLTTVFCEVLDAQAYNDGVEEVHAVYASNIERYDRTAADSYDKFPMSKLEEISTNEDQQYGIVKVYLEDARAPLDSTPTSVVDGQISPEREAKVNSSFIRNGIVSISLIDGPGLNKDNYTTTAVFTRQTEIDVIVFVVQAQDGFTLSATDFVRHASMDKALVFVVVNKYRNIRDKARCERRVMQQLSLILPKTWEQREELVHFVEAGAIVDNLPSMVGNSDDKSQDGPDELAFAYLEESLRSFLLLKRSVSKLAPAQHYLANLLADLAVTAEVNVDAAIEQAEEAELRLSHLVPIHEKLKQQKEIVEEAIGKEEEERVMQVRNAAVQRLSKAIASISVGGIQDALPAYPGVLDLWDWAGQVKASLLDYLESQVVASEEDARESTIEGVKIVQTELSARFLPTISQAAEGAGSTVSGAAAALPQRVFNSQNMFSRRREALKKAARGKASLAQHSFALKHNDIELSVLDMLDLDRLLALPTTLANQGRAAAKGNALIEATSASALSAVSLGVGAITMFGTRIVGIKTIIEAVTTLTDILGSRAARKWAGPAAAALTLGLGAYLVYDLPRAIPHNVGKKLHASLTESHFTSVESDRIAFETRKVLRLCGWDLRERFRAALEASEKDRKDVEGRLSQADAALEFLEKYMDSVDKQQKVVASIAL